jgi:DNA-directed RNA polymerase subunit RPC12/RpoP
MSQETYECAICGYKSNVRAEFVEFLNPVKLSKVIEKAKTRGRNVRADQVKYICLRCSVELYQEETKSPRSVRVICPRCGEVIEVWL